MREWKYRMSTSRWPFGREISAARTNRSCRTYEQRLEKKLVPTCMLEWMWAALQNGNGSRWVRYVRSEFTGVRHVVAEPRRSWRGVHSCAVYGGLAFSPTRRLLQPPSEHRRHLVITDSFFSFSFSRLESSMNGCALIINVPWSPSLFSAKNWIRDEQFVPIIKQLYQHACAAAASNLTALGM